MDATTLNLNEEKRWYDLAYGLGIFTIVYNLAEGIVATAFGFQDETLALFGFGMDSFIEMISGIGIVYMITESEPILKAVEVILKRQLYKLQVIHFTFWLQVYHYLPSSISTCKESPILLSGV